MTQNPIRHYVVLKANRENVNRNYFNPDRAAADEWARRYIAEHIYQGAMRIDPPFTTAARPSNEVTSSLIGVEAPLPHEVVVALNVYDSGKRSRYEAVHDILTAAAAPEKQDIFSGSSPDIPFTTSDHWCIGDASDSIFSNRSGAERLLGVDYLRKQNDTTGKGVNIVIADQGLNKRDLGARYGGGWKVGNSLPGSPPATPGSVRRSHGMMIAHNILKVAPKATLFDLPVAPVQISDIHQFISMAHAAYLQALADIAIWKSGGFPGPWILVNPWGIFDRKHEHPPGYYTTNPNNPFSKLIVGAVNDGIDVVFAAGNCGQFCPDNRCGGKDQGPGSSIWGANSLEQVLTVGAVRADSIWLGYSSQGPGQPLLGPKKPDLCAVSQFCEDDDAFSINTGTSAACGLASGIIAALRSRWNSAIVSPGQLKDVLNQEARKPPGLQWGNDLGFRLGNGILDARAAFQELKNRFP